MSGTDTTEQDERDVIAAGRVALHRVSALLPHLTALAALVELAPCEKVRTAGISRSGRLLLAPQWFLRLSLDEQVFVIAHELMHLALDSHARAEGLDAARFNVAHDHVINVELANVLRTKPPSGALYDPVRYAGQSAEEIYKSLTDDDVGSTNWDPNARQRRRNDASSRGWSSGGALADALRRAGLAGEAINDVLDDEVERQLLPRVQDVSPTKLEAIRRAAAGASALGVTLGRLRRAEVENAARGTTPGSEGAYMAALHCSFTPPWERVLCHWLEGVTTQRRSFSRASRRGANRSDVALPGRIREGYTLHIVLDTSGSMVSELPRLLGIISTFGRSAGLTDVHVLQADTAVQDDRWVPIEELDKFPISGFGGSDMSDAMYRLAEDPTVTAAVVLTDGDIAYPESAPPYDVLWGTTGYNPSFMPTYGLVVPIPKFD